VSGSEDSTLCLRCYMLLLQCSFLSARCVFHLLWYSFAEKQAVAQGIFVYVIALRRCGMHDPGFESRRRRQIIFSKPARRTAGPTQPPVQWIPVFFPGVKRPWREVNHSLPSGAKVENEWSRTSAPPMWLYGVHKERLRFWGLPQPLKYPRLVQFWLLQSRSKCYVTS
jgi:hypothetical protein